MYIYFCNARIEIDILLFRTSLSLPRLFSYLKLTRGTTIGLEDPFRGRIHGRPFHRLDTGTWTSSAYLQNRRFTAPGHVK